MTAMTVTPNYMGIIYLLPMRAGKTFNIIDHKWQLPYIKGNLRLLSIHTKRKITNLPAKHLLSVFLCTLLVYQIFLTYAFLKYKTLSLTYHLLRNPKNETGIAEMSIKSEFQAR